MTSLPTCCGSILTVPDVYEGFSHSRILLTCIDALKNQHILPEMELLG